MTHWFAFLCTLILLAAVFFGWPLFCMLKRFWGWRRLWRGGN